LRSTQPSPFSTLLHARTLWLLLVFAAPCGATIVDRIAIVVNQRVITEVQLDEELRVTAFLNREPIRHGQKTRREAAERLIQQELIRHEMAVSQYPFPTDEQVEGAFNEAMAQLGGADAARKRLAEYQLNDAILKEHLQFQLMLVRFIDFRFRPDMDVSDADMREYYQQELAKWKQTHTGAPPTFEESRANVQKRIADERIESAMSSWVNQVKRDASIVYLDKELQ
jgi:hypothetical protein